MHYLNINTFVINSKFRTLINFSKVEYKTKNANNNQNIIRFNYIGGNKLVPGIKFRML
jgi:hypothetical protein